MHTYHMITQIDMLSSHEDTRYLNANDLGM